MKDTTQMKFLMIPCKDDKRFVEESRFAQTLELARDSYSKLTRRDYTHILIYKLRDVGHTSAVVWEADVQAPDPKPRRTAAHRNAWTDAQEEQLWNLRVEHKLPYDLIATRLGRTASACSSRFSFMHKRREAEENEAT